ncbi:MAG: thioredoxin family protein [Ignavibacteriae bacterium]|nr:thioredoxin family protein [Ignavibacteriota bacterium]
MSPVFIIALVLVTLFITFQIYVFVKSKKSVGNPIPFDTINNEIANKIKDKKSLIYFYSPSCHNCKKQTPIIEKLKSEFQSIISVDISKDLETARAFNIMGTPSILLLGTKTIEGVFVGVKNESFIREKLHELT